jgi:hypothetical protein
MAIPKRKTPERRRGEISMCSEVLPDGRYGIVMSHGKTVRLMDRADVTLHCQVVMEAAVRAQHDAAILNQLHRTAGVPLEAAGEVLARVRARRIPLDAQALQPLGLEPGVTLRGKPFIAVKVGGRVVGEWEPGDARNHALGCLELAAAVDLDNHYRDVLTEDIDVGDRSYAMVSELGKELKRYKVVPE